MDVVGTLPITFNPGTTKRQSYRTWLVVLDRAAQSAAARARPSTARLFSLRCEVRLCFAGSTMKGDEHVDHLDLRRKRVASPKEAGVLAEVWALKA